MIVLNILRVAVVMNIVISQKNTNKVTAASVQYSAVDSDYDQILGKWFLVNQVTYSILEDDVSDCITINVRKSEDKRQGLTRLEIDGEIYVMSTPFKYSNDVSFFYGYSESNSNHIVRIIRSALYLMSKSGDPVQRVFSRTFNNAKSPRIDFEFLHRKKWRYINNSNNLNCPDEKEEENNEAADRFVGMWYMIFELYPSHMRFYRKSCKKMQVSKEQNNLKIKIGLKHRLDWHGAQKSTYTINQTELHKINNNKLKFVTYPYKYFNDDNEILIHEFTNLGSISLWSRKQIISNELIKKYISPPQIQSLDNWNTVNCNFQ